MSLVVRAPLAGRVVAIEDVPDPVFSSKAVGDVGEVDDRPRHRGGDGDHVVLIWFGHGGFLSERGWVRRVSGRAARQLSGAGRRQKEERGRGQPTQASRAMAS